MSLPTLRTLCILGTPLPLPKLHIPQPTTLYFGEEGIQLLRYLMVESLSLLQHALLYTSKGLMLWTLPIVPSSQYITRMTWDAFTFSPLREDNSYVEQWQDEKCHKLAGMAQLVLLERNRISRSSFFDKVKMPSLTHLEYAYPTTTTNVEGPTSSL